MHPAILQDLIEQHHTDLVAAAETARLARARRSPAPATSRLRRRLGGLLVSFGERVEGCTELTLRPGVR